MGGSTTGAAGWESIMEAPVLESAARILFPSSIQLSIAYEMGEMAVRFFETSGA